MAITAQELTKLLMETKKARESLDKVLDYVDLINNHLDDLPADVKTSGSGIRDHASEIDKHIQEIRHHINTVLNKIPIDTDEVKDAAKKLLLYQGDIFQIINWAETQKKGHEENSYWWRYWQAVYDILKEQKGQR